MKATEAPSLLLDTCAVFWIAGGVGMSSAAKKIVMEAGLGGALFVSAASAWEVGLLSRVRTARGALPDFSPDPKAWFARFVATTGIKEIPLISDIAIETSLLPGDLHQDPADRMIIATARHYGLAIVTRDRRILAYAEAGFVAAIPC